MKRRSLQVVLAVILVLAAACSRKAASDQKTAVAEQETAVADQIQIGIVFDVGGKGDKSFNDSAYRGLAMLAKEYSGYIKDDPDKVDYGRNIELKYLEPKQGGQDREQLLRVLAEDGYDLIYGVGFMFTDSIAKAAKDFPDVHFGLIDGYIGDLTPESNITCLSFAEHEGSFLVGYIAAMLADGANLGFIGGMDIPLIHKFHGGFFAGAIHANSIYADDGMLLGQYIGQDGSAFNNPKVAESIAVNMYNQGAAIIYHASGASGTGLFKAAKDMGKMAIGVDSDQGLVYSEGNTDEEKAIGDYILTSMLKQVDNAVFQTSKAFIDTGSINGGYKSFNLSDDGVGYALNDYNRDKLSALIAQIDSVKAQVISGEISVPDHEDKL